MKLILAAIVIGLINITIGAFMGMQKAVMEVQAREARLLRLVNCLPITESDDFQSCLAEAAMYGEAH